MHLDDCAINPDLSTPIAESIVTYGAKVSGSYIGSDNIRANLNLVLSRLPI